MNPLKIKASTTPITSANFQGLQVMSDTEIKNYIAYQLTLAYATAASNGNNTADINITTDNSGPGTSIGTFTDTDRTEATGTHPATGGTTSTTYYAKQVTATDSGSASTLPVGYGTGIEELTSSEINTDILDKVINAMVTESSYTAGQYKLQASAPAGGTWTSRYTITDVANGGNTTTYLWQKTTPTTAGDGDLRPLKVYSGNNVKQMSDAEIQQMLPNFRNRIISTGIGTYSLQASAPVGGTWVQMGDAFSDTREQVVSQNYTGNYSGSYTGNYTGTYSGNYTGPYSGAYTGNYTGSYSGSYVGPAAYSGAYSGSYTGNYVGTYAGTGPYSGAYSSAFAGTYMGPGYAHAYVGEYTLYYGGFAAHWYTGYYTSYFSAAYTGYYTGYFTGYYTGPKNYSGTYSGAYTGYYTGYYTGTAAYSGTYSGTYTGYYTGYYSGTYTGYYSGTYSGPYSGTYSGTYSGPYSGTYSGTYAGNTVISTKETVSTVRLWVRTA